MQVRETEGEPQYLVNDWDRLLNTLLRQLGSTSLTKQRIRFMTAEAAGRAGYFSLGVDAIDILQQATHLARNQSNPG